MGMLSNSSIQLANRLSTVLASALSVFPNAAQRDSKTPYKELNAMFSVTPDGLPFAGAIAQSPGLFIAAAIWITHAASVARLVADLVSGVKLGQSDMRILEAFNPLRFKGQDPERLKSQALGTYNNIYNQTTQV
jgi:glycine/D-amino acid oxidase-like deaminating enzyme